MRPSRRTHATAVCYLDAREAFEKDFGEGLFETEFKETESQNDRLGLAKCMIDTKYLVDRFQQIIELFQLK